MGACASLGQALGGLYTSKTTVARSSDHARRFVGGGGSRVVAQQAGHADDAVETFALRRRPRSSAIFANSPLNGLTNVCGEAVSTFEGRKLWQQGTS